MASKPQYGGEHQKARRIAKAMLVDGTPCAYCGRPMYHHQKLDLDHVIPVALGGTHGPTRLVHSKCNSSHGARLGNRLRKVRGTRTPYGSRRRLPTW